MRLVESGVARRRALLAPAREVERRGRELCAARGPRAARAWEARERLGRRGSAHAKKRAGALPRARTDRHAPPGRGVQPGAASRTPAVRAAPPPPGAPRGSAAGRARQRALRPAVSPRWPAAQCAGRSGEGQPRRSVRSRSGTGEASKVSYAGEQRHDLDGADAARDPSRRRAAPPSASTRPSFWRETGNGSVPCGNAKPPSRRAGRQPLLLEPCAGAAQPRAQSALGRRKAPSLPAGVAAGRPWLHGLGCHVRRPQRIVGRLTPAQTAPPPRTLALTSKSSPTPFFEFPAYLGFSN